MLLYPRRAHAEEKLLLLLLLTTSSQALPRSQHSAWEDSPSYKEWYDRGTAELLKAINVADKQSWNFAKNIILFIGDGMGISTITASRIRSGQLKGESGEDSMLTFEEFPHVGLIKTYSMDSQVTDSAAAGTSMLTGVKVNSGVLGCHSRVTKGNCSLYGPDTRLKTILHRFMEAGLSTGIVTNSRLTHATPASAYAQTPHREWEGDTDLPPPPPSPSSSYASSTSVASSGDGESVEGEEEHKEHGEEQDERRKHECGKVDDIAKQLVMDNPDIKVLLGGGRRYFLDNSTADPETGKIGSHHRRDGLDLVEQWKRDKELRHTRASYVWNKKDFDNVDPDNTDFLLGLFSPSHMPFDTDKDNRTQPNIVEMTKKAIQILERDRKGYFLLVEGARIDFGHHDNSAATAINETLELDQAVAAAVRMTNEKDTLILVTADHSHAFSIQGYAPTGNDILGKAKPQLSALDGLPYTTLGYANGPSFGRHDLTGIDTTTPEFRQAGCVPLSTETHAGEDVSVYARGPMSQLVHATHDQSYIYHVMEYAACVGRSQKYCHYNYKK